MNNNLIVFEFETDSHGFFWGGICSQWYKSEFVEDGNVFKSAEMYMMYHKSLLFNDVEIANKILKVSSPREIKSLGRCVKDFDEVIWIENRERIVEQGNLLKFSQNNDLFQSILKYKDKTFVEASPYDKVWGIGLHFSDNRCLDEKSWQGLNLLGKALNKVINILDK